MNTRKTQKQQAKQTIIKIVKKNKQRRFRPNKLKNKTYQQNVIRQNTVNVPLSYGRQLSNYSAKSRREVGSEMMSTIKGTTAFTTTSIPIQPGLGSLYPRLSQIANLYERYKINRISFRFQPNSSATTKGIIMMAIDYDAHDILPTNKVSMSSYYGYCQNNCYLNLNCNLDVSQLQTFARGMLTIRSSSHGDEDIKTFDAGNLVVATQDEIDTSTIGDLYIDYDITFMTSQLKDTAVNDVVTTPLIYQAGTDTSPVNFESAPVVVKSKGDMITYETDDTGDDCVVTVRPKVSDIVGRTLNMNYTMLDTTSDHKLINSGMSNILSYGLNRIASNCAVLFENIPRITCPSYGNLTTWFNSVALSLVTQLQFNSMSSFYQIIIPKIAYAGAALLSHSFIGASAPKLRVTTTGANPAPLVYSSNMVFRDNTVSAYKLSTKKLREKISKMKLDEIIEGSEQTTHDDSDVIVVENYMDSID